ncbi:hypothetical protein A6770_31310 [Nostoc minutum NIES-26]|uniref:Uncharacterized protein n=1 Tax=Nostoc minutum NIES-26 TaxID=1844469 RepID=A0A367Q8V2_9NOSO|nr:hypothetical protein A6770_31310 [Nostoc minutum NIES-26]
MCRISFPRNILLKCWTFWIIVQCTLKITYELKSTSKLDRAVEDFVYGLIVPWFSGAMWSDFKFVSYCVITLHIYIVALILLRKEGCLKQLKQLIWILFWLAMYAIWIEPWITLSALIFLPFPAINAGLFTADVAFSWIWFLLTHLICDFLDREFD